jgi:hypothetical protein
VGIRKRWRSAVHRSTFRSISSHVRGCIGALRSSNLNCQRSTSSRPHASPSARRKDGLFKRDRHLTAVSEMAPLFLIHVNLRSIDPAARAPRPRSRLSAENSYGNTTPKLFYTHSNSLFHSLNPPRIDMPHQLRHAVSLACVDVHTSSAPAHLQQLNPDPVACLQAPFSISPELAIAGAAAVAETISGTATAAAP